MEPERLREVIASAQVGEAAGFEALLSAYGSRLYGYFLRATGRHHDAEDLLGEIMLRLVRQLKNYDEKGRFEPWLFRVAANLVRDRIRRSKARPTPLSLSIESDSGRTLAEQVPGDVPAIESGVLAAEASAALEEALAKLDGRTREMILLRHFGQMGFREIADICECPVGTVLARVHRGLRTLRRLMGANDDAE